MGPSAENGNEKKRYRLLARNMVLAILVVAVTPLVLTGGIILTQFSKAYQNKVNEHMSELVQKHSQNIDRFLTDRLADIRVLARSHTPEELSSNQTLAHYLSLLREEYGGVFVDLGLVDATGVQVAYAGPFNLFQANYADAGWFKSTLHSEHHISDVFTGLRGSPHFIVAVKQVSLGRAWILRATIDFEYFNSMVKNIRLGHTGFAFILNQLGEFQTNTSTEIMRSGHSFLDYLHGNLKGVTVGRVQLIRESGREWIVAASRLKNGAWVLYLEQEWNDAFSELLRARLMTLLAFFVGTLLIFIVALVLSRRMVNRIALANSEKAVMNEKFIEAGRLASIGELAAGIAHEINNPVAIMVEEAGWIQDLLEDDDPATEDTLVEIRQSAHQIRNQGDRCKEITHKLLSFARKTDPLITEVDLNRAIEDTVSLLKQKTRYANVHIETDLYEDLPQVHGSPSELQQVMVNLVNNAVDAIGAGGGTITLSTRMENGGVIMRARDDGPGIPEPLLGRVFDPFFTTKPVGQGTGLGLSICFGIISKLGGDISVSSQVGFGTEFTIRLPMAESSAGSEESGPAEEAGDSPRPDAPM